MATELKDVGQGAPPDDPYKDLTPKKALTNPKFYEYATEVRRHILGKIDPQFAGLGKDDQDHALSMGFDYWDKYYNPESDKNAPKQGILDKALDFTKRQFSPTLDSISDTVKNQFSPTPASTPTQKPATSKSLEPPPVSAPPKPIPTLVPDIDPMTGLTKGLRPPTWEESEANRINQIPHSPEDLGRSGIELQMQGASVKDTADQLKAQKAELDKIKGPFKSQADLDAAKTKFSAYNQAVDKFNLENESHVGRAGQLQRLTNIAGTDEYLSGVKKNATTLAGPQGYWNTRPSVKNVFSTLMNQPLPDYFMAPGTHTSDLEDQQYKADVDSGMNPLVAGATHSIAKTLLGFSSVGGIGTMLALGGLSKAVSPLAKGIATIVDAGFGAYMVNETRKSAPEIVTAYKAIQDAKTPEEQQAAKADFYYKTISAGTTAAMATLGALGAVKNARELRDFHRAWGKARDAYWAGQAKNITPAGNIEAPPAETPSAPGMLASGPFEVPPDMYPGKRALLPAPNESVQPVAQPNRLALPPAAGLVTLPGGEPIPSLSSPVNEGESGGLPPFKRIEKTLVGPDQGVIPEDRNNPERPVTQNDLVRMKERIQMIEDGTLKTPGINIEEVKKQLARAELRHDDAMTRQLREKLGVMSDQDEGIRERSSLRGGLIDASTGLPAPPPEEMKGPYQSSVSVTPMKEILEPGPLDAQRAATDTYLRELGWSPENPEIKQLSDIGIKTIASPRQGTYEGKTESGISLDFPDPNTTREDAELAAIMIANPHQAQVAIISNDPNSAGHAGLKFSKPDGSQFTDEELAEVSKSNADYEVNPEKTEIIFSNWDTSGVDKFFYNTISAVQKIGLEAKNGGPFRGGSYLVDNKDFNGIVQRARDERSASGRSGLPDEVQGPFNNAFGKANPEAARELANRRSASEAAARIDRQTLQHTAGSGEVDKMVSGVGGGTPGEDTAGRGEVGSLVGPPERRGLEGPVPSGTSGTTEPVAIGPETGRGRSVLDAIKARNEVADQSLSEGQTPNGLKYLEALKRSPWTNINGRDMTMFDPYGHYDKDYLRMMLADPAVRKHLDMVGRMFDEIKDYFKGIYPEGSLDRAQLIGGTISPDRLGSNGNGDLVFGNGGPDSIAINGMQVLNAGFSLVRSGELTDSELAGFISGLNVSTSIHELEHIFHRTDNAPFEERLARQTLTHQDFIKQITDKYAAELSANDMGAIRDLIPAYNQYANKSVAILWAMDIDGRFADVPDTFTRGTIESLAKRQTPSIEPPPARLVIPATINDIAKYDKNTGKLKIKDLERTSEAVNMLAGLIGREGVISEPRAWSAFTALADANQGGRIVRNEFKNIYKAAVMKSARSLPGMTKAERATLTPVDLARIFEYSQRLDPIIKDLATLSNMGKVTRGWYLRAGEGIKWLSYHLPSPPQMLPPERRLIFTKLFAGLSPQQGVRDNFLMALKIWRLWADPQLAADEFPDLNLHPDIVPFDQNPYHLETLITTSMPDWEIGRYGEKKYQYERDARGKVLTDPETGKKIPRYVSKGTVDIPARVYNTITALTGMGRNPKTGEWLPVGEYDLSGRKVTGFTHNLMGHSEYTTADTHVSNMVDVDNLNTKSMYLAVSSALRQSAKNIKYTPMEQQETSWSPIRAIFLFNRRGGTPFLEGLKSLTPALLREYSANTEIANMLLEDPDVQRQIEKLGIDHAVREAQGYLQQTSELGRDLSDAKKVDPGILESIAERSDRVAAKRAAKNDAEQGGDEDFGDVEQLAKSPGLEPPLGGKTKKLTVKMLGEPLDSWDGYIGGAWIMPSGEAVRFNRHHFDSLAKALGLGFEDIGSSIAMNKVSAAHNLVRVRISGWPNNPRPGVEIYGPINDDQMRQIARIQKDTGTNIVFQIMNMDTGIPFAMGEGIGELRRELDESLPDGQVESTSMVQKGLFEPHEVNPTPNADDYDGTQEDWDSVGGLEPPPDVESLARVPQGGIPPGRPIAGAIGGRVAIKPRPRGWAEAARVIFAPTTRGPEAKEAMGDLRANLAKRDLKSLQANEALKESIEFFRWRDPTENLAFIDNIENAQPQQSPSAGPTGLKKLEARAAYRIASGFKKGLDKVDAAGLDAWSNQMAAMLTERVAQVRALGTGKLQNLIENYFPHMWEDPAKASEFYGQYYSNRPFEGSKSFLMKRKIPTVADGIAAGLKPISNNPAELMALKLREMDRYIAANQTIQDLDKSGLIQTVPVGQSPQSGWVYIDDKIAKKYTRTPDGSLAMIGQIAAPEPVARLINNHLSPGLRGWTPYDQIRWAGNALNMVQLGISGFHLVFTANDAVNSAAATALVRLSRGEVGKAALGIAKTSFAPITAFTEGRKLLAAAISGLPQSAEIQKIIDMAVEGGAGFKMDSFYDTGVFKSVLKNLADGGIAGHTKATLKLPFLVMETAAKPVLDYLVPRMKLGVLADMMRAELDDMGPDPTQKEVRERMGSIVDSVDNRMGQLRYDNIGWNRVLKDLLMASVRSVGWNLGTFREFGGAATQVVKQAQDLAHGEMPKLTHKQGYAIMTPIMMGIAGAAYMLLHTGKWPEELKDYYFPKTGLIKPDGTEERVGLPSYMKDLYAYSKHPITTLSHKIHPLLSSGYELGVTNQDYFGNKIRQMGGDPLIDQLTSTQNYKDVGKYVAKTFLPFSLRNYEQRGLVEPPLDSEGKPTDGGLADELKGFESFFGVVPAPASVSKSDAEEVLDSRLVDRIPKGSSSDIEARRKEDLKKLNAAYRLGGRSLAQVVMDESEYLRPGDLKGAGKKTSVSHLVFGTRKLGIQDALDVYEASSDKERLEIRPIIIKKLRTVRSKSKAEKEEINSKLEKLGFKGSSQLASPPSEGLSTPP